MHIIFGKKAAEEFTDRFIVLPLDRIKTPDFAEAVETFCIIPGEKFPIAEMKQISNMQKMHIALMEEYNNGNWAFCCEALEQLHGKFNGELDSFYTILKERISKLQEEDLPLGWDGTYEQIIN
jgi:hypothetical protein